MNTILNIIADCIEHNIALLKSPDGKLIVDSPKGVLSDDLRMRLRTNKDVILRVLENGLRTTLVETRPKASVVWLSALDQLSESGELPDDVLEELRNSPVRWENEYSPQNNTGQIDQ